MPVAPGPAARLGDLDLALPLLAAPMAGGPTTPALVTAAARAGGLGFLAGGYLSVESLAEQIRQVRAEGVEPGVNLFAPNPQPVDPAAFRRYAEALQVEADVYGLDLASAPVVEDDDAWAEKVDLLLAEPVAVVSLTFGLPDRRLVQAWRAAGTLVIQTVTSPDEARAAADLGVDWLAVQSSAAGGHWGTLTPGPPPPAVPLGPLLAQVRAVCSLPIVAAGGLAEPADIRDVIEAGAVLAMVGTALLRTPESATSSVHRAALADPARAGTVLTRAFTGRPARALPNRMTERFEEWAPLGYPAIHHLTRPLRRAAAAAGDGGLVNLWAGTGFRSARAEPVADVFQHLSGG